MFLSASPLTKSSVCPRIGQPGGLGTLWRSYLHLRQRIRVTSATSREQRTAVHMAFTSNGPAKLKTDSAAPHGRSLVFTAKRESKYNPRSRTKTQVTNADSFLYCHLHLLRSSDEFMERRTTSVRSIGATGRWIAFGSQIYPNDTSLRMCNLDGAETP